MNKQTIYTNYTRTLCDMLTPVAAYRLLRDQFHGALLLESADYHDPSDSKSFICLEAIAGFEAEQRSYTIFQSDGTRKIFEAERNSDVLIELKRFVGGFERAETDLVFNTAGLFGYASYESIQYMEDINFQNPRPIHKSNPDLKYHLYRYVLVFDHFKNELFITEHSFVALKVTSIQWILDILKIGHSPEFTFDKNGEETSPISDAKYMNCIERGVDHCHRGDVFQIVLSRAFHQPFLGDDYQVYRALRSINPSPYLFYFDYGSFRIFGSSPESQLQVSNGQAEINPIAGTVLRGANADEDSIRAETLQSDPKEKSEHVMLVDLARNDLSKHAEEVHVDTYAEIQYFSHVIHMVSRVVGQLNTETTGLDVFADTFPAGTLSGAPKYRAMQLIDEIENTSRNFYGGAIGFLGFDGSVNHAIIIRSILSRENVLTYQAGAGVVADSNPVGELKEVDNKVAALRAAILKATQL